MSSGRRVRHEDRVQGWRIRRLIDLGKVCGLNFKWDGKPLDDFQ